MNWTDDHFRRDPRFSEPGTQRAPEAEVKIFTRWVAWPAGLVAATFIVAFTFPFVQEITSPVAKFAAGIGLVLLWFLVIAACGIILGDRHRRSTYRPLQDARGRRAREVLDSLIAGERSKSFFVYLRSFQAENLCPDWYLQSSSRMLDHMAGAIDDELAFVFDHVGPIVSLGETPNGHLGIARLTTSDSDWRQHIELLLAHCKGLIVFPWVTPSISEEVRNIYSSPDLLAKTLFLLPPVTGFQKFLLQDRWERVRKELPHFSGYPWPDFTESGLLFHAYGGAIPIRGAINNREDMQRALLAVLKDARHKGQRFHTKW
jgi:hypothetical protein